jgi:isopentenyl diphosphate isomerase/L-lactate dehydrogenase-like FMN-dependent dehydrogenase
MSTTLFGKKYPSPILMAPIGVQSLAHPSKEPGHAEVCSQLDIPYIMSSAANSSFEEVAAASRAHDQSIVHGFGCGHCVRMVKA